jgi:dihydroorotate dehydrogenase
LWCESARLRTAATDPGTDTVTKNKDWLQINNASPQAKTLRMIKQKAKTFPHMLKALIMDSKNKYLKITKEYVPLYV